MPRFRKPDVRRNAQMLRGAIRQRMRIRRIRAVVAPADVLTLINAFAGFVAIIVLTGVARIYEPPFFPGLEEAIPAVRDDRFLLALLLMGVGLAMDALDGTVARRFGGSRLGADLDTLADAQSFVLLPALLVLTKYGGEAPFRSFLVASLILLMGILRLARFNANPVESETKTFQGLPTPWMAITVALMVVTGIPLQYALPFAALLAFLMMSNVAYPKSRGRTRYVTYLMVFSALVIIGFLVYLPESQSRIVRTLFVIAALTIAIMPLLLARRERLERRRGAGHAAPTPPSDAVAGADGDAPYSRPPPTASGSSVGPKPRD